MEFAKIQTLSARAGRISVRLVGLYPRAFVLGAINNYLELSEEEIRKSSALIVDVNEVVAG